MQAHRHYGVVTGYERKYPGKRMRIIYKVLLSIYNGRELFSAGMQNSGLWKGVVYADS